MKKKYFVGLITLVMLVSFQTNAQVDVTFKVDMTGQPVDANGVHVVGSINGWNTSANQLTQEGVSNIYSTVIQLSEGWYEYKFLNGNAWGTEESANYPCAPSNGNRFVSINNTLPNVTLEAVPFNGCNASGTGFEIIFNVDMSSEGIVPVGNVRIAGWFNGWNDSNLSLPDVNGNFHSATLRLPTPSNYPVTLEYKYVNNGNWETPDADCATVNNSNRVITLNNSRDAVYDVFNACNYVLSTEDFTANSIKITYNKTERLLNFYNDGFNNDITQVRLFDFTGKPIKTIEDKVSISDIEIDFQSQADGVYFVRIESSGRQLVKKILIY